VDGSADLDEAILAFTKALTTISTKPLSFTNGGVKLREALSIDQEATRLR
jgi:hypothetical protein